MFLIFFDRYFCEIFFLFFFLNFSFLSIAPAKKTPLILNSFHFHSFFFGVVVSGRFFTLFGPFWTLAGTKNSSKYDHITLSPYFHPRTVRLAKKPSLISNFDGFYRFSPSCGHFWLFVAIPGLFGPPPWALGFLKHLHKVPDVYIHPLAMSPAKKNTLIFEFFSFSFIFLWCGCLWSIFHLVGPILDPCWGQKFFKVWPYET